MHLEIELASEYFPQILADIYTTFNGFEFKVPGDMKVAGLNKGASYMYAVTPMTSQDVVVIRFKSPIFNDTHSGKGIFKNDAQVRYWSFCTSNFPKNETLNCLPDFESKPDQSGWVALVVGTGDGVKKASLDLGYAFLPDIRKSSQRVMGFVYRNLLPNESFKENEMYQGDYAPFAKICYRADFISGSCR